MSASRDDFGIVIRSALLQRGARQKFSLFFLICFSIVIFFLDNFPSRFMDTTRSILNDGIYRISSIATSPLKFVSYLNNQVKGHFFIYEENKILRSELEEFKKKDFKEEFLFTENERFKKILGSRESLPDNVVLSKVLMDKESPFLKSIIINKGTRSKIQKGMPVLDNANLLGRVVEVNYLSSRVLLLNDLNSRVPVTIENTSAQAILTGTGLSKPKLEYLPELFQATQGSTVFTSGKDGIFSPGIPIGKIELNDGKINVKLFSDPNQITFASIILSNALMDTSTRGSY